MRPANGPAWYAVYAGGVRVRLDTTDEDRARRFNRSEHVRPIPPSDSDYRRLYPLRSDAESINRALDDSSWLGRAHSVGRARQLVNSSATPSPRTRSRSTGTGEDSHAPPDRSGSARCTGDIHAHVDAPNG